MTGQKTAIYNQARVSKDRNFDGEFYFAVKTTGIFCRPSCPSPHAKDENVLYFESIYRAMDEGFRPCHRCRPDMKSPGGHHYVTGAEKVDEALQLIYDGYLNYHSLPQLAVKLCISERHLRTLFASNLGISPVKIARYHKSLFAKKLLMRSNMKISDIVSASGFGSIRQFNDTFKSLFDRTPRDIRREHHIKGKSNTVLFLTYNKPFYFDQILAFMAIRAIRGVEKVSSGIYSRTFRTSSSSGYFTVCNDPVQSALVLTIESDDIRCYIEIYNRVRSMFDLDRDFSRIKAQFINDPTLKKGMVNGVVPRLPMSFNTFEFVIRAVLGQQISVKAATTLASRIVYRADIQTPEDFPCGLDHFFPGALELESFNFTSLGITTSRYETLRRIIESVLSRRLLLSSKQPFEKFRKDFSSIKGIGNWTVNYVAMRGLGFMDAFPAADLGIIKALSSDKKMSIREIEKTAERWRPYRAYAALCLWNIAHDKE